ncbi:hypothetical protein D3C84_1018560 [compost metagenome]
MTVGDDQQQPAFTPGGDMAVFASGGLQLAGEQLLQLVDALGFVEKRSQWLFLA